MCGVDEAGRGPLAGPVYAAAVILPPGLEIEGANDSKKLTEKKREALFLEIKEKALAYCVASASEREIDDINILNATYLAMARAVEGLSVKADYALIDGNRMPRLSVPGETIVKGDGLSMSIACASILAKVTRDHVMMEWDQRYPQYQFAKHKGYGTKLHMDLIRRYGPCELHRQSFLKKILGADASRTTRAQSIGKGRSSGSRLFGEKRLSHFREELSLPYGETDIIAEDGQYIIFVEVKTRNPGTMAGGAESVDEAKRKRLAQTAQTYLSEHPSGLQPGST
ncbi:ribonuclease HII [[Clostridium] leptum]|uniref:Ribonuclease HII n=1 Tax=[Clostridium] leptum TaxID=1535 RepID=A0A412B002_9FIRM|nr:ribonuclease HII [[Clostridium] leptum]